MTSPIGLWVVILVIWSQKWNYLDERVELGQAEEAQDMVATCPALSSIFL